MDLVQAVRAHAIRLDEGATDYDGLLKAIGDARVVMIGDATHGTHEFYRERALITQRLIQEKGFDGVAVEADWPDAYRVNRYVRGEGSDQDAAASLDDFGQFPTWMWRNAEVVDFIAWLRAHNDTQPADARAGFYGLDLYSLRASNDAVLSYLDRVDPAAARRARDRYSCFDQFGEAMQQYGYAAAFGLTPAAERDVVAELVELQRRRVDYSSREGRVAHDDFFFAAQNARLVRNAGEYYRAMFQGRTESWNLRDEHMAQSVEELLAFLDQRHKAAKLVLWAHNSHLGDACATDMVHYGEVNIGQLVRQQLGAEAVSIGFTTDHGTVMAASEWEGPPERKQVRPGMAGSYERLFHDAGIPRFLLRLRDEPLATALVVPHLERAIGVLYLPKTERENHYFYAKLAEQFDFVIHIDETRAVDPLERSARHSLFDSSRSAVKGSP